MGHSFLSRNNKHVRLTDSEIEVTVVVLEALAQKYDIRNEFARGTFTQWSESVVNNSVSASEVPLDELSPDETLEVRKAVEEIRNQYVADVDFKASKEFLNGKFMVGQTHEVYLDEFCKKKIIACMNQILDVLEPELEGGP